MIDDTIRCYSFTESMTVKVEPSLRLSIQSKEIDPVTKRKGQLLQVLSIDTVLDRLTEIHNQAGHGGIGVVKGAVSNAKLYITTDTIKKFRQTCQNCCETNPPKMPTHDGAKKPIESSCFRYRFQIDLIDMREQPQPDVYGKMHKWILHLKDHFTRMSWLRPLPSKEAKFVANELNYIFSFIGYPLLLQSDNGGEFTAAVLMEMLNDLYPHCTTVNGRARTPRDRGSVEKGNDTVKKKLQSVVQDRRQQGKDANWVELLSQVMPAMLIAPKHTQPLRTIMFTE